MERGNSSPHIGRPQFICSGAGAQRFCASEVHLAPEGREMWRLLRLFYRRREIQSLKPTPNWSVHARNLHSSREKLEQRENGDWLAEDAVQCEPFSLLTGKLAGNC